MELPVLSETQLVATAGAKSAVAGQWTLMLWKFRRQKVAMASLGVVVLLYLVAVFAEFLAPYGTDMTRPQYTYAPPQGISLFLVGADGSWQFKPHASGYKITVDEQAMRRVFTVDPDKIIPIGFFVTGETYKLWGLFEANVHFIGPIDPSQTVYFLGSDRIGRDLFSRLIYGTRISLSIGLVGVVISLVLGVFLGGISGYYGGAIDTVIQRVVEIVSAMPTIPLWMGLAAAIPIVLVAGVGLLHGYCDRLAAWVDIAGARGARTLLRPEGRGLCHCGAPRRLKRNAAHFSAYAAFNYVAPARDGDPCHTGDDHRGNLAILPRDRPEAASCKLGRAFAGRAEYPRHRQRAVAAVLAGSGGHVFGPVVQFSRRRLARRGGSLWQLNR